MTCMSVNEHCESYQYTPLINEPSRTASLIDLFLSNELGKFALSGVSHIGLSDHRLIYVTSKKKSHISSASTNH